MVEKDGTGNSSLFLSLLSKFICIKVAGIDLRNQKYYLKETRLEQKRSFFFSFFF